MKPLDPPSRDWQIFLVPSPAADLQALRRIGDQLADRLRWTCYPAFDMPEVMTVNVLRVKPAVFIVKEVPSLAGEPIQRMVLRCHSQPAPETGGSQAVKDRLHIWAMYNTQGLVASHYSNAGGTTFDDQLYLAAGIVAAQWLAPAASE